MKRLCASYAVYFNKKYKRVGHLFQSNYKASHIMSDSYLQHITWYIHLNPNNPDSWQHSSLSAYVSVCRFDWIKPAKVLQLFAGGAGEYVAYMQDYADHKHALEGLKYELANTLEWRCGITDILQGWTLQR